MLIKRSHNNRKEKAVLTKALFFSLSSVFSLKWNPDRGDDLGIALNELSNMPLLGNVMKFLPYVQFTFICLF